MSYFDTIIFQCRSVVCVLVGSKVRSVTAHHSWRIRLQVLVIFKFWGCQYVKEQHDKEMYITAT